MNPKQAIGQCRAYAYWIILLVMAAALVTGCFDNASEITTSRKFMKALIVRDLDDLQTTVIPERQDDIVKAALLSFGVSVLIQEVTNGRIRIGYSGLKFRSLHKDGDEALVEVQGKVNIYYRTEPLTTSFRFNLQLQKRNRHWLVSNVDSAIN